MTGSGRPSLVMVGEMPEPFGGVAYLCYEVCLELSGLGVQVDFLDTERGPGKRLPPLESYQVLTGRYTAGAVQALRSPKLLRSWTATVGPLARKIGLRRSLQALVLSHRTYTTARSGGASAIVAHHAGERGLAALIAARALDVDLTLFIYGAEWAHPGWNRDLSDAVAAGASRVIACSSYTKGLCAASTGRDDIAVIPPGVDHDRFHPSTAPNGSPDGPRILFMGAMHPRKGPDVFARAITLLTDLPGLYVFAGPNGPMDGTVRSIIGASSARNRVDFLGPLSPEEVPRVLAQADIFVFPTVWGTEGFGMVAAEAMACGVPVVASRIGGVPEVVMDGDTGLLVEPGDAADLASKLRRLILDGSLRRRLAVQATQHAQRYRWAPLAEDLARNVIGGAGVHAHASLD